MMEEGTGCGLQDGRYRPAPHLHPLHLQPPLHHLALRKEHHIHNMKYLDFQISELKDGNLPHQKSGVQRPEGESHPAQRGGHQPATGDLTSFPPCDLLPSLGDLPYRLHAGPEPSQPGAEEGRRWLHVHRQRLLQGLYFAIIN